MGKDFQMGDKRQGDAADEANPLLTAEAFGIAMSLSHQLHRAADPALIALAEKVWGRMVEAIPHGRSERALALSHLGSAALMRFERTGEGEGLEKAVMCLQAAVDATDEDGPMRAEALSNLGFALLARAEQSGTQADLDDAIEASRRALDLTPDGDPDRPTSLSNLAAAFQARFRLTGQLADLDAAIGAVRAAVTGSRAISGGGGPRPQKTEFLANLGNALLERATQTREPADLDAAVEALSTAVADTEPDHHHYAFMLYNLGGALLARFRQTGSSTDLEAAIEALNEAVGAMPADHPDRGQYKALLQEARDLSGTVAAAVLAVLDRLERIRQSKNHSLALEQDALRDANHLADLLRDHPESDAEAWEVLGWIYTYRWQAEPGGDESTDLEAAVEAFAHCLLADGDVPEQLRPLAAEAAIDMAVGISERTLDSTDTLVLTDAARLWWRVINQIAPGHPRRAFALAQLGKVLRARLALPDAPPPLFSPTGPLLGRPDEPPTRPSAA